MIPVNTGFSPERLPSTSGVKPGVVVENHGDRPIRVGSHYHFYEVNPALKFDREAAKAS